MRARYSLFHRGDEEYGGINKIKIKRTKGVLNTIKAAKKKGKGHHRDANPQ